MLKLFKNQFFWLALILVLAFAMRLYKIDSPIADWHSWRQADTAAVTRNFVKEGFTPLLPKYDDMSGNSDHPIPNPNRFRFVEFPIYNIFVYPFYLIFGVADKYSRLVSVLFSLGSISFLYFICRKYLGVGVSLLTSAIYAFLPFNVFFSRTTLPEPTFLFFVLGMVYFVDKWIWENKKAWGILAFIFTAISFLIKPWAIFFTPPLIYSAFLKFGKHKKIPWLFFFSAAVALTPFLIWRFWILQQPQGIPASGWLLNSDDIRFHPAFWWWLISERMGREILGATGLVLFVIGLIFKPKNGNYFFHIWALSMFLYFSIFATGNVRHNYYQYIFVPIAAIFLTKGFLQLIKAGENFIPRIWTISIAFLFLPLSFYFSFLQIRSFYQINNPAIIEAGKEADRLLEKDAIVVAPYNGDSAFLYQTNRAGFAFIPYPLTDLISEYGVTHFVSVSRDDKTNWVLRHFSILEDKPNFIIADLRKIKNPLTPEDPEP